MTGNEILILRPTSPKEGVTLGNLFGLKDNFKKGMNAKINSPSLQYEVITLRTKKAKRQEYISLFKQYCDMFRVLQ